MSRDITHQEKHDFIMGEIWSKHQWLAEFSSGKGKRPDFEIHQKQGALKKLEAIAEDYKRAVERKSA